MTKAKCAGKAPNKRIHPEEPDLWFPAKGESPNPGKIFCFTCPVRKECDDYRLRTGSEGMWAGVLKKKEDEDE